MVGFGGAVALADTWRWPMLVLAVLMLVWVGPPTWPRPPSAPACSRARRPDAVRGRLQACSPSWWWWPPGSPTSPTAAAAVSIGAAAAASGGGVLVLVGTVLAAVAFPAFVRYRVVAAIQDRDARPA